MERNEIKEICIVNRSDDRLIFMALENRQEPSCLRTLVRIRSCDLDASQRRRNATNEWSYANAPRRVHVLVVVFNSSDRRRLIITTKALLERI